MNKEAIKLFVSQERCRCIPNEEWVAEFKKELERAKDIHETLDQLVHSELVVPMQETERRMVNELVKLGFITADGYPNEAFLAEMLGPEDFKKWQSEYYGAEYHGIRYHGTELLRLAVRHPILHFIPPIMECIDPVSGEVRAPNKVRHPHLEELLKQE